ncbi:cytochrome P460 family protein [Thalassomonas actiniarum]|uniref:Cytochrome P460 family protein n=1 Tax=Thalassomonas actiniarum TaxID=485447 RepID=A0AAE9YVU7_9GAMM|nr:cytochrome P460 family protein [Thalassomonas actiniarum]WDE01284.1 cytochrome P460 family protein [Thalassomonas actiniarum]
MTLKSGIDISKVTSAFLLSLLLVFAGSASANANQKEEFNMDEAYYKSLFTVPAMYPQTRDYRKKWSRLTGFEFSGLHWNNYVVIYVNKGTDIYRDNYIEYLRVYQNEDDDEDEDEEAAEDKYFKGYEVGTIFLKENYTVKNGIPHQPTSLTLMVKKPPGYAPTGGDWEYTQFAPNGDLMMRGNNTNVDIYQSCAKCHENMQERDYVFSTFYTEQSR